MKLKVIMLETTKDIKEMQGSIIMRNNRLFTCNELNSAIAHKKLHTDRTFELYLIDESAEIKEGIYFYDSESNEVHKSFGLLNGLILISENSPIGCNPSFCSKIIASTQQLEGIPQLSEQSIKLLVDYYNKNGKMPEFVDINSNKTFTTEYIELNCYGKVNITIPEKKMYSREEVVNLLNKFKQEFLQSGNAYNEEFINFIKQNL